MKRNPVPDRRTYCRWYRKPHTLMTVFLLDLVIPEASLLPFQSWLQPARLLAHELFPDAVLLNRLHTFSAYERMSTALTVAQVYGVQRLCNHYAARLTPLPARIRHVRVITVWHRLLSTLASLPVHPR